MVVPPNTSVVAKVDTTLATADFFAQVGEFFTFNPFVVALLIFVAIGSLAAVFWLAMPKTSKASVVNYFQSFNKSKVGSNSASKQKSNFKQKEIVSVSSTPATEKKKTTTRKKSTSKKST